MERQGEDRPEPAVLIIADISGYTRYMTANVRTLAHSQTIITELVEAIIAQVEFPLKVAKLEGDAVFLYARKSAVPGDWNEQKKRIGRNLLEFFDTFSRKADELSQSTTCTCNACTHIEKLKLKLIVHSGEALFHQVLDFHELAGIDVILVHRLLKNSVEFDQYLLLTDNGRVDVAFPVALELVESSEDYAEIGRVKTWVHLAENRSPVRSVAKGFRSRFSKSLRLFVKLLVSPVQTILNPLKFKNLSPPVGHLNKIAFAFLSVMLLPFMLPVGAGFAAVHAARGRSHHHEHLPDGSCCRHSKPSHK